MKDTAFSLLRELTEAHGAPGHEDAPRAIFRRETSALGTLSCDRLGSVMCEVAGGGGPRVMLTAHLDEVGFMVQDITPDGFLQMVALGGWWTHTLPAQRVRVKTRSGCEVLGVISSTPPHFLPEADRSKVLPLEKLFVDIGAASRLEVEETFGVRVGDPMVPDTAFVPLTNPDYLCAKAFDNRVGVAAMIQALQQLAAEPVRSNTLIGVATVQEEVGCRGAKTAAALARPDVALILEGTPADDTPGFPSSRQAALGKGPQIRVLDPSAIMSKRLVDFVRDTAVVKGIPHQIAVRRGGGTDASSFQAVGLGAACVVIGVPARYIHSHNSIIHLDDYLATVALIVEIVHRLDNAAVAGLYDFLSET